MENLRLIKKYCYSKTGRLNPNIYKRDWWSKRGIEHIYEDVLLLTDFLGDVPWKIRMWHYENQIFEIPECKSESCSNQVKWKTHEYQNYCSVKCNNSSPEFIERRQNTVFQKYGTTQILSDRSIREKIKSTNLVKYGHENVMHSEDVRSRLRETNLSMYGVPNPMQCKEVQEKRDRTNIERYGHMSPLGSDEVRKKSADTIKCRYGVTNIKQRHICPDTLSKLSDKEWIIGQYETKSITTIANENEVSVSCVRAYLALAGISNTVQVSSFENEVYQYVSSLVDSEVIRGDRTVLSGKEIDIYIPELGIAFECNGTYWHSEISGGKDKNYHINKTTQCEENNIKLVHIWQHEWDINMDLIKSRIKSLLGKSNVIYARKCIVIKPSRVQVSKFLVDNHIQGYCNYKYAYGLQHDGELVALMTFGKSRYDKKVDFELLRFCNVTGVNVVGGASKLMAAFTREHTGTIISYCDAMRNSGNLYHKLGFKLLRKSPPSYQYTKNYMELYSRQRFQKHKLTNLLENFDASETEWQNMKRHGYDRIWDCGTTVWVFDT